MISLLLVKVGTMAKVRLSHVTNSSSSSFVVSHNPDQKYNTLKLTLEIDLDTLVEDTITTEEGLNRYYSDNFRSTKDDPDYLILLEEIRAGRVVKFVEIKDYGDAGSELTTLIRQQCFYQDETNIKKNLPDGVKVIIDETY